MIMPECRIRNQNPKLLHAAILMETACKHTLIPAFRHEVKKEGLLRRVSFFLSSRLSRALLHTRAPSTPATAGHQPPGGAGRG